MSKKKANRSAIKQKRKTKHKCKKPKRIKVNTWDLVTDHGDGNNVLAVINNKQDEFQTDQIPSTSRACQKQISPAKNNKKRSPWRSAGGRVNKFSKLIDDQARRLIKRSVYLIKENQTPKKYTPLKIVTKHVKKSKISRKKIIKGKSKDTQSVTILEEGEIRTDGESFAVNKDNKEDEDDCFVIEPNIDEITIDDDNDNDNTSLCSNVSSNYQSLGNAFKERVSSTPYQKNSLSVLENSDIDGESAIKTLPFFVDVCGRRSGLESINSTDTFIDCSKFSTLGDKSILEHQSIVANNNCSEIIDLDDTQTKEQSLTLKGETGEEDDSVIFVSETNKNDFIPIVDNTIPSHKILKVSEVLNTPVSRQRVNNNSLFTLSETKKINQYNENAYNPSGDKTLTNSKRMVIIDGSNVAFKHGLDQAFSVKGLKIAIEYFEKMGHEVKAVIPQFRMNRSKSSSPEELVKLHKAGKIVQTPCKNLPGLTSTSYDDRFILQLAFELDAAIVSNDNYRDLLNENPAFKKIIENRVIGYTWCNDIFILPKDPYGKWGPTLHSILNR